MNKYQNRVKKQSIYGPENPTSILARRVVLLSSFNDEETSLNVFLVAAAEGCAMEKRSNDASNRRGNAAAASPAL